MMDGPGQGIIAVGPGLGRGWRGLGAGAGRWRQREPASAGWSSQCAGCQAHLAPWVCDVPERSPWRSQYWCCPALGHGPVPGSQPALSPSPVQPPSTHSFSQEGSGIAEHPVPAGTPPDEGEGLAGLGRGSEGLPASWPGPPPSVTMPSLESLSHLLATWPRCGEQGWSQERGVRPLLPPCQVS